MSSTDIFDVIIVGAGPAGLTAGIYACRGGLKVAVVEGGAVGGLASTAANVENYPGVEIADGFSLCYTMLEQCKAAGARFVFDRATRFDLGGEIKRVVLAGGGELVARRVILAVGASPRKLGLEGEDRLAGKGVSYCATCDGALFKGKTVAVAGGGNTALEDAFYLEKLAAKVYLIHRRDALRADAVYEKRLKTSGIIPVWDSVVRKLVGDDKLTQIEVENVKTNILSTLFVDCVFVAIGQTPNTSGLEMLARDGFGYVITDEEMRTNVDGVYAAGDVRHKSLRQIVTACADGAIAANTCIKSMMRTKK